MGLVPSPLLVVPAGRRLEAGCGPAWPQSMTELRRRCSQTNILSFLPSRQDSGVLMKYPG